VFELWLDGPAAVTNRRLPMATNIRLQTAREALGITQLQLAEKVGRKEIEISRYETGRAIPSSDTMT
jgi:ribosome-binding protein aMBF1 (putative translation factor)